MKWLSLLIMATCLAVLMSFSTSHTQSDGGLGDVRYSILPPAKFQAENGDGWVLMDDNIKIGTSDLKAKHGITALPDARGMFIRGLNLNRGGDEADAYAKDHPGGVRTAGEYQPDSYLSHDHDLRTGLTQSHIFICHGWAGNGAGPDGRMHAVNGAINASSHEEDVLKAKNSGGNETRPKNIALYTYIKIND